MPDQAALGLLRIAMIFGGEDAASHVRDAMQGHADIVYAASAADFDAARIATVDVTAALVNLDGGDWLDAVETSLGAAGIAVVYNDPEISRGLDGWARARWMRHLMAKLRGSADVDPPRPEQAGPPAGDAATAIEPKTSLPTEVGSAAVERPLSPQEIDTMTADFAAVQGTASVQVGQVAPQPGVVIVDEPVAADVPLQPIDPDKTNATVASPPDADEAPKPVQIEAIAREVSPDAAESSVADPVDETGPDYDGDLDVDTETLSAMIDSRLTDSEPGMSSDSPEVWRVVEGSAVSPVYLETDVEAETAAILAASGSVKQEQAATAARDDSDVLSCLPALDDWQLVDPEVAPAPAASRENNTAEPVFSDSFAALELVPMETGSSARPPSDPIERWLHDSESGKRKAKAGGVAKTESNGGNA